jgi:hypothetical protein
MQRTLCVSVAAAELVRDYALPLGQPTASLPSLPPSIRQDHGAFQVWAFQVWAFQVCSRLPTAGEPQISNTIMSRTVCGAFHAKIDEQMERSAHLATLIPDDELQRTGDLLGHLLDCISGFCAALYAAEPKRLAHFQQLRELPVNRWASPAEFRQRLQTYQAHIAQGFALLEDADLARSIPTVFVPAGVPLATLLLGNLEHVINHKRQLFEILKRLNLSVGTADLYRI